MVVSLWDSQRWGRTIRNPYNHPEQGKAEKWNLIRYKMMMVGIPI